MNKEKLKNHPLNGIGLEALLGELVRHYGWEILAEQINVNAFKNYPSFKSSMSFMKKTQWAREKLEAFYLYKFMQFPKPDDEQHQLPPRERVIDLNRLNETPAEIELGDPEFFDDPLSGPVFPSKKAVSKTRDNIKTASMSKSNRSEASIDPWAKWKEKNQ